MANIITDYFIRVSRLVVVFIISNLFVLRNSGCFLSIRRQRVPQGRRSLDKLLGRRNSISRTTTRSIAISQQYQLRRARDLECELKLSQYQTKFQRQNLTDFCTAAQHKTVNSNPSSAIKISEGQSASLFPSVLSSEDDNALYNIFIRGCSVQFRVTRVIESGHRQIGHRRLLPPPGTFLAGLGPSNFP
jgi:hypothetical protein